MEETVNSEVLGKGQGSTKINRKEFAMGRKAHLHPDELVEIRRISRETLYCIRNLTDNKIVSDGTGLPMIFAYPENAKRSLHVTHIITGGVNWVNDKKCFAYDERKTEYVIEPIVPFVETTHL